MKKIITITKYRFQRGYNWIGIIGIGFVVCAEIQRQLVKINIDVPMWLLFPLGVIGIWLVGFLEERLGLFGIEQKHIWNQNPEYKEFRKKMYEKGGENIAKVPGPNIPYKDNRSQEKGRKGRKVA